MRCIAHCRACLREAGEFLGRRQVGAAAAVLALLVGACAEVELAAYTAKRIVTPSEAPQGVYKVGEPYQVDSVWYTPAEDPDYDHVGVASWYGE